MAVTNITYTQLLSLIADDDLIVGEQYRITDYVTTVRSDYYQAINLDSALPQMVRSAGHQFDIIVTATDTNMLSHDAIATPHTGDTYFNGQNLSQWQIKYITEQDYGSEYNMYELAPWAIADYDDGGKGAIYYMKDEYGNEAPYDFKNIEFARYAITGTIAESDTIPAEGHQYITKLRQIFSGNPYNLDNMPIYLHQYACYKKESTLAEDYDETWGGIYTMDVQGTRMFAVLYNQNQTPKCVVQVSGLKWCHTFGYMTSTSDTETSDLTLTGNVTNCVLSEFIQPGGYERILQESIFLATSSNGTFSGIDINSGWWYNTVKQGFVDIQNTQNVTNSLFIAGGTLYVRGVTYNVVIYNATGTRTIYANNNTVLFLMSGNYWSIPFRSRNNTAYEARVYGLSGNNPVVLTGASNPLITEEDKTEDMFIPLRTQSGYLRVVIDRNFDYTQLLPVDNLSRPIVLLNGNNEVMWTGFLKAQNFNLPFLDYNITLSLPIMDSLSNLESTIFEPDTSQPYINLAGILNYCVTFLNNYEAESYDRIILGEPANISTWLLSQVATTMFYQYSDDEQRVVPKYNCKNVLQNMMTFLGMTLRVDGTAIYILPCDKTPQTYTIDMSELNAMAEGTGVTKTAVQPVTVDIFNLSSNPYISTNNKMKLLQGCNEVTVNNERRMMSESWSMPSEEIADKIFATTEPTRTVVDNKQLYTLVYRTPYIYKTPEWTFTPIDCKLRIWELIDTVEPYFNWNVGIEMQAVGSQYHSSQAFRLRTVNPVFLKDCVIVISASGGIYENGELNTSVNAYQPIGIYVGDKYYFGAWKSSPWSTVGTWNEGHIVNTWPSIEDGKIQDNRQILNKGAKFSGFGAFIDATELIQLNTDYLFDYLTIDFYRPTANMVYTSIEVKIIPNEKIGTDYSKDKEVKMTQTTAFSKNISKLSIFVVENEDAPLLNRVVGITKDGHEFDPASDLAARILEYGSVTRNLYNLQLRNEVVSLTPRTIVPGRSDGKIYSPVSISKDWREDKQEVILMEI